MTSRSYCFTLYADPDDYPLELGLDAQELPLYLAADETFWTADQVRYAILQVESCPTTARAHIQGYVELRDSLRPAAVRRALPVLSSAAIFARRGTRDEARDYCRKEETSLLVSAMRAMSAASLYLPEVHSRPA